LNPRPLGYEPYDVRLPCLASSLVAALTSADGQRVFMPGPLRLPRLNPPRRVSCTNACTNPPSGQLVRVGQHDRLLGRTTGREIRSYLYLHPVLFRSVRNLGLVSSRCLDGSAGPKGCSSVWLLACLSARR